MTDQSRVEAVATPLERVLSATMPEGMAKRLARDIAKQQIEANDSWLKATYRFDLEDAVKAHRHGRETTRRRAIWEGFSLPVGTTRNSRVCDCQICTNWTYEFPEDVPQRSTEW